MTAGELLVQRSMLPTGTAMQHLLSIQVGAGITISDGFEFVLDDNPIDIELQMNPIDIELLDDPIEIEALDTAIVIELDDETPVLEIDQ